MRFLVLVALAGCGSATPVVTMHAAPPAQPLTAPSSYPWHWRALSEAEVEARKTDFTKKNPGAWSIVTIRNDGLVFHLDSTDPGVVQPDAAHPNDFTDADLARWDDFLRRNAELFGIEDPSMARLKRVALGRDPAPNVAELRQYAGERLVAEITIGKRPNGIAIDGSLWPMPVEARVTDALVKERVAGDVYDESSTWTQLPPLDCAMSPHPSCGATPLGTVTTWVTATHDNIALTHRIVDVPNGGGAFDKRHVICVTLNVPPVPFSRSEGLRTSVQTVFIPRRDAPKLPLAIDALTDETIDSAVCR
jgi:hypothetical protein